MQDRSENAITGTADITDVVPTEVPEVEFDEAGEPKPLVINTEEQVNTFADPKEVPNVMLSPEAFDKGRALPEGPLIIGRVKIILPDADGQKAGFYAEHAGELVGQYPQFKFKVVKGEKNVPSVSL